ncbi:MAG: hypothetical protein GWM90_31850, partial [Gemmatimonadetes bacterium]|nr:hypothetical protein [Gemmatimonadota bacterium]NIQ59862.1 hypothetical protein [Gemmatimonadota bacterium]NIU80063.1 hypothetical protein [Gammaproteobacteria bacterium]NIX48484.1 hypothetical protein [Gemmatimonadota bacterium]NIY12929.1 hypothetical protein [Gemmatimonadota bacterium]
SFALPAGSRLMDTGGYKGRGRRLDPTELRAVYGDRLGLPPWACVNEYGMTELLSQYYDTALRTRLGGGGNRAPAQSAGTPGDGTDPEGIGVKRGPG